MRVHPFTLSLVAVAALAACREETAKSLERVRSGDAPMPAAVVTTTPEFWAGGDEEGNASIAADEVRRDAPLYGPSAVAGATPLPEGRTNAATVRHGGRIYVLGGRTAAGVTSAVDVAPISGGGLGTWAPGTPLPGPLELHAAVAHGGFIFVIGGLGGGGSASSVVYSARIAGDGTLGAWTTTSPLPGGRSRHGAAAVRGRLYVLGGENGTGTAEAAVYSAVIRGDGQLGTWSAATPLTAPRRGLRAVAYGDRLYAVGGAGSGAAPLTTIELAQVDTDGAIVRWWATPAPAAPAVDPAVVAAAGRLYTFGDCIDATMPCATPRTGSESAAILPDGSLGAWSSGAVGCCTVSAATAVRDDRTVFIVGGLSAAGAPESGVIAATLGGEAAIRPWVDTTALPVARQFHATAVYGSYVYVLGGCTTNVNCLQANLLNTVHFARVGPDGTLGPWTQTASFTEPRWGHTAVAYDGYLYLIGGKRETTYFAEVQRAPINTDGSLGAWSYSGSLGTSRYRHTSFAYHGYLYVVGGADEIGNRAEVLRGTITAGGVGTLTTVSTFPTPRRSHASTFYAGRLCVLGGYGGADLDDVQCATIDDAGNVGAWSAGPALPRAMRSHAAVAYNGWLYLSGGYTATPSQYWADVYASPIGAGGALGAWRPVGTLTGARAGHSFDAIAGRLVTTGGDDGTPSFTALAETAAVELPGGVEPWLAGGPLVSARSEHQLVAWGRWLYQLGGLINGTTPTAGTLYSELPLDGTPGSWSSGPTMPRSLYDFAALAVDGRIYVAGGFDGSAQRREVLVSTVRSDGLLGVWTPTTSLPAGQERRGHALAHARGYLYVVGGDAVTCTTSVLRALINADGTVGAWSATTPLPAALMGLGAVGYGGYLYALGGETCAGAHDPRVYSAPVNADGSLGAWSATATLPVALSESAVGAADGFLYAWGGHGRWGNVGEVLVAPIHENGELGSWTFGPGIANAVDLAAGTLHEGRLVISGGQDELGTYRAEVYVAKATTPAARGLYARLFDLGSPSTLNAVSVFGSASWPGTVQLEYRAAPATGVFGFRIDKGRVPLAAAVTLGDTSVNYAWLRLVLDDRTEAVASPGVTAAQREVTEIFLDTTGGGDSTPPVPGAVNDGTGPDIDLQSSTTGLSANWAPFTDAESGISGYEWAVGTSAGASDIRPFTSVGLVTSASAGGLSLVSGTRYYVTVRATNGVGLTATGSSDGVVVDSSPPAPGAVNDGAGVDIDLQSSATDLSANWAPFTDAESGISGYEWAIGTSAGATDTLPFTSVGLVTNASATGLSLVSGTRYYVTVRATNGVGLTATGSSDGVVVDDSLSLAFVSSAQSLLAGECSGLVTLELRDALGAPAPAPTPATVTLLSDSTTLRYHGSADTSCGAAPLASLPIAAGQQTIAFRFRETTAGGPSLDLATDFGAGPVTASQGQTVSAAPAAVLVLAGFPSPVVAGTEGTFDVIASDSFGNTDASYVGTVTFSSSDGQAIFATPSYAFTPADAGRATLRATLISAGTHWLRGAAGALSGEQVGIVVTHAPVSRLAVGGIPATLNVGALADLTVRAEDAFGNTAVSVTGALTITSSDPDAQLPSNPSIASGGTAAFPGSVRFATPGVHRVDASLTASPAIAGAQVGIVVEDQGPPWIFQEANLRAAVGVAYRYSATGGVRALGTTPLTFTACGVLPDGFVIEQSSGQISWVPQAPGSAAVCVEAANAYGTDQYAFQVDVQARAPTPVDASFTVVPASGPAPLDVVLDGAATIADPGALPLMFEWSPGDGSATTGGAPLAHRYLLPGGYHPRLTAYDAFGSSGGAEGDVAVSDGAGNSPPRARILPSATAGRDQLTVDFACDCAPGSGALAAYRWEVGGALVSSSEALSYTFGPGRHEVRLAVVDTLGLSASDTVQIAVTQAEQEPPWCAASASPVAGPSPLDVTWRALAGSPLSATLQYAWRLPGGGTDTAAVVRTTETVAGPHAATVTVTDNLGLTCQSTAYAAVLGTNGLRAPRILSSAGTTAACGIPYAYSGSGRAAADGEGPLVWSLTGPTGAEIDAATGAVAWTPSRLQAGTQRFTVSVSGPGGTDSQDVDVLVTCPDPGAYAVGCGCTSGAAPLALTAALAWLLVSRRRR